MKVHAHGLGEAAREHVVFDHLCRHAHQRQRVLVVAAVVAGHVQRAHDLPEGVEDRRAGAGQRLVGVHEMLVAMHGDGLLRRQRRADGVGALGLLAPVHAGHQGHAVGLFKKVVVAHGVQHHAPGRRQQHHAVGVGDLAVQRLHHRHGMLEQEAVLFQRGLQLVECRTAEIGCVVARYAKGPGTLVRLVDDGVCVLRRRLRGDGGRPAWHGVHVVSRSWNCVVPVFFWPPCPVGVQARMAVSAKAQWFGW